MEVIPLNKVDAGDNKLAVTLSSARKKEVRLICQKKMELDQKVRDRKTDMVKVRVKVRVKGLVRDR
jgi:hypothetical protein